MNVLRNVAYKFPIRGMSWNNVLVLGLLASSSGVPFQAIYAQEASSSIANLDEIVVTARRRAESLKDVPVTVAARTGEQLERAGVSNVRDLNLMMASVRMDQQGLFMQPNIRGVTTETTQPAADSNIAIYIDGVFQADQTANTFELVDVDRVEVLKGPQGTLFGRNATGGAINIVTREPSIIIEGKVLASYGSYNNFNAKGYVTAPLVEDKIAYSLSGGYHYYGGHYTNDVTGKKGDKVDIITLRGKVLFQPTERLRMILTGSYRHGKDYTVAVNQPLNGNSLGAAFVPLSTQPYHFSLNGAYGSLIDFWSASARIELETDVGTLRSTTAFVDSSNTGRADVDGSTFQGLEFVSPQPHRDFTQDITFSTDSFADGVNLLVGAFYYDARDGNYGIKINPGSPFGLQVDTRINTSSLAGFGEVNIDLTDKLELTAGARYTWEKKAAYATAGAIGVTPTTIPFLASHTFKRFTPHGSVLYKVTPEANIYFTYSQGFKSGTISALSFSTAAVKPEIIKAYEGGFKLASGGLSLNMAAFLYDYTDLQVQTITPLGTDVANAASVDVKGLELEAGMRVTPEFTISTSLAYLDATYDNFPNAAVLTPIGTGGNTTVITDVSGNRVIRAPKYTGTLNVNYRREFSEGTLDLTANVRADSRVFFTVDERVSQGARANVNMNAKWTFTSGISIGGYIRNLTANRSIAASIISVGGDVVVYAPRRTAGVEFGYKF